MTVQEWIARRFAIGVRPGANPADGYHITYTPRSVFGAGDAGLLHAIGNSGSPRQAVPFEAVVQLQGEDVVVRVVSSPGGLEVPQEELEQDAKERVCLLHEWLARLTVLVNNVEGWVKELGWATRRIEKPLEDSQIGKYKAPGLLMQEGVDRVLLEPIARLAPGTEGVVDLYLMPAYDDIATLYFYEGGWNLHYTPSGTASPATVREARSKPLSKESLQEVLEEMKPHAA